MKALQIFTKNNKIDSIRIFDYTERTLYINNDKAKVFLNEDNWENAIEFSQKINNFIYLTEEQFNKLLKTKIKLNVDKNEFLKNNGLDEFAI